MHEKGSDIDTLLVGPACVTHEMFFEDLCENILAKNPRVTNFSTVPSAFVPIAKFDFDGVSIDLIYAQTAFDVLDDRFEIHEDNVMKGVSPSTIRSLNGVRVTDLFLDLVPDKDVFRKTVRLLKIWAKRRGVYGNSMGYLGGVSYAILVARICQIFPNGNSAIILKKFFEIYDSWHWPTPVCLNQIKTQGPGDHVVWNREANVYDRMPIITPAYPAQNSTYNVTFSNFSIIKEEIERGREILSGVDVEMGKEKTEARLEELIEENDFFRKHKNYFMVTGTCREDENSTVWFGWIESRIRKFVSNLEELMYFNLIPHPKGYSERGNDGIKKISFFIGSKIVINKSEISDRNGPKKKKKTDRHFTSG